MSQNIPFSGATGSFLSQIESVKQHISIESENALNAANNNTINLPTQLNELDRQITETVNLSIDAAASLNLPFGASDNKLSRIVFVQEYKKYKEIQHRDETLQCGISIRWILNIKKLNASAKITSLPMVAASAQFNNVSASVMFEVIGISSPEITDLLPTNVELNADTYVDLKTAFEAMKSKIHDADTIISPAILGVRGTLIEEDNKLLDEAVAMTYALKKIKGNKPLQNALDDISHKPATQKEIVKSVYEQLTNSSSMTDRPTEAAKEQATNRLKDML